jgi:hypothetical protein
MRIGKPLRTIRYENETEFCPNAQEMSCGSGCASHLCDLATHLRRKNFYPIVLPAGVLDQQQKELWLPGRMLVTDKPEELAIEDVPVLEFSLIDTTS